MNSFYFAYGMVISSDPKLPELLAIDDDNQPDLTIKIGTIEWEPAHTVTVDECIVQVEVGVAYFCWANVGKFMAREGREVIIEPAPQVEESTLRLFLLGAVLAAILHQRGFLVLHASAVELEEQALVFMGEKGYGKSTLVASLHVQMKNDFTVLADDIVALDWQSNGEAVVLPGFPQMKLGSDAMSSLGIDEKVTVPLHPLLEKSGYRAKRFRTSPVILRNMYVLSYGDEICIERLTRQDAFLSLMRHSFLGRHIAATGRAVQHFDQCTKIANSVPIDRLNRPRSLGLLQNLADTLTDELRVSSAVAESY